MYFTNNKIKRIHLGCNLAASFAKVHYQENNFFSDFDEATEPQDG